MLSVEFRFLRNRPEGDRKRICCSGAETCLLSPVGPLSPAGSNHSTTVPLHRNKNVEPLQIWLHPVRTWGFLLASGNLHVMDRSRSGCHLATEEKVAPNMWILTCQAPCHPLLTTQSLKKKKQSRTIPPGLLQQGCVYSFVITRLGSAPSAPIAKHQRSDCEILLPRGSFPGVLPWWLRL